MSGGWPADGYDSSGGACGETHPSWGWVPPQRWAEVDFPRVSNSASSTPYTFDTLVTGMTYTGSPPHFESASGLGKLTSVDRGQIQDDEIPN